MASTAPPSGAPKMAPMPEPIPVDHRHPGIGRAEVELPGQQGGEAGADLTGRSLPTTRSARTDGERRGDDLDDDGPETDAPRVVVDRRDGRVGAVSLGFGGEAEDEDGAEQGPETDDQWQAPRGGRTTPTPAGRLRRPASGRDSRPGHPRRGGCSSQERFVEDDGADAGHGADQPRRGPATSASRRPHRASVMPGSWPPARRSATARRSGTRTEPSRSKGPSLTGPTRRSSPARAPRRPPRPAAGARRPSALCISGGIDVSSSPISARRRSVTWSTRARPASVSPIRT